MTGAFGRSWSWLPRHVLLGLAAALLLFPRISLACDMAFAAPAAPAPMAQMADHQGCGGESKSTHKAPKGDSDCLVGCAIALADPSTSPPAMTWTRLPPQMAAPHALEGTVLEPADPPPRSV